jgi:predicted DNA-binding transcriptional regulator YafY
MLHMVAEPGKGVAMKGERVAQLELLLHSHPEGLRRAEIARRLGVHRSTISRYVDELKTHDVDIYEDNNLIKIKENENEANIDLSVYESLALNMSAEALVSNTEFQNAHLASGLRKIALNMRSYAPKVSDNIRNLADQIDKRIREQESGGQFNSVLEVLIDSWVSGRIVKVVQAGGEETELAPYFIGFREDENNHRSPISVTGRLRHTQEIVTIDIATITSAMILDETYTIPDNLKPFKVPERRLDYASGDTIPLVLNVKESSALNVFHSLEHGKETITKTDRGMEVKLNVENSIDLLMKLFQCGASVEIVEPAWFRKKYTNYLKDILAVYS